MDAGFQMAVLPDIAGADGRFPPMAVKLKGVENKRVYSISESKYLKSIGPM